MHVKEVPAENYCKKKDCREWPQCCASNYNRDHYQRQGHDVVIPVAETVCTIPTRYGTTGLGGQDDPAPIDVRPPYYALAFIMRMRY